MTGTQQEAAAALMRTAPMLSDEHQRRAAFVETLVFEAAELIGARQRQNACTDEPAVSHAPLRAGRQRVKRGVGQMRKDAKQHPRARVSREQQNE